MTDDDDQEFYRQVAMEQLEAERQQFEAGNKMALFGAISICAQRDLVMPEWVALAFINGYHNVLQGRLGSWDEAFGRPHKKGKHLENYRKNRSLRIHLFNRANKILDRDSYDPEAPVFGDIDEETLEWLPRKNKAIPIDEAFFERLGEEFNISTGLAQRLYYEAQKAFQLL